MKTYRVKNIFGPTIQGEGSFTGTVVLFLRLAGCNKWTGLAKDKPTAMCKFCDTDFRGGEPMTAMQIREKLKALGPCKRVVISGGEPTLQLDIDLLQLLTLDGFQLHLETNGSRQLGEMLAYFYHITMSPKQSMAETQLEACDDLKILYPAIHPDITMEAFEDFHCTSRFLQAVWDNDYAANLKATICRILGNPAWKLSLQTHKITGVE